MQHHITTTAATDIAQINIPNNRQASLFVRYGATLDNGSAKTSCSRSLVINLQTDGSGNVTSAMSAQNNSAAGATDPVNPFFVSFAVSATAPAVLSAQPAGYGGGVASGEMRFTIEDAWGNEVEEL